MVWLILSIVLSVVTVIWTAIVVYANGMSDAPSEGFQGGATILVPLGLALFFFAAWYFGW